MIMEKVAVIKEHFKVAQNKQKSYANPRRMHIEFSIGVHVFLKVLLVKGIMRFEKKEKLSPRHIRLFEIFEKIRAVIYKLALPPDFSKVYPIFHMSMLRRYILDPSDNLEL